MRQPGQELKGQSYYFNPSNKYGTERSIFKYSIRFITGNYHLNMEFSLCILVITQETHLGAWDLQGVHQKLCFFHKIL